MKILNTYILVDNWKFVCDKNVIQKISFKEELTNILHVAVWSHFLLFVMIFFHQWSEGHYYKPKKIQYMHVTYIQYV